ncbi:MAG: M48 family metallopeptidase [Verrucomicrobia bacterium]|nr:M48 family metallopeptidase [Verrucomicrobiota bacterium]
MGTTIQLGDTTVDVVRKDIKNVHLSVHPPAGRVTIAAPSHMSLDTIRVFAITKLGWIRQQQTKLLEQEREAPREFLDRESHYVWGKRYLMQKTESDEPPVIELCHRRMHLRVRAGTSREKCQAVVENWYRQQVRRAALPLIARWESRLGVKVDRLFVQRMKTKWGSCNPRGRTLRLNTDLAKKPPQCLEYLVVHELIHLLEPTHNARFTALMDHHMPQWRSHRQTLNRLPIRHESWGY